MLKNRDETIVKLSRKLKSRKLKVSKLNNLVKHVGGTMQTLFLETLPATTQLGPTVGTPIEVNGIQGTALVDIGSPAIIISLEFVIGVLVEGWKADETLSVEQNHPQQVYTLKSYGGTPVEILAQIAVTMMLGKRVAEIPLHVQKEAPEDLLGTGATQSQQWWDWDINDEA